MTTRGGGDARPLPRPPGRRRGRLTALVRGLAVVLVAALAGGVYAAGGVVVAAGERRAADQLLQRTGTDGGQVRAALRPPAWPAAFGSKLDYAQATAAAGEYATGVSRAQGLVAADLPALRQASDQIRSRAGSFLLIPERPALEQERQRVDAALEAFASADQLLRISADQVAFVTVLLDAEGSLLAAEKVGLRNPATGLSQLAQADAGIQQAAQLARGKDIPTQLQALTGFLETLSADYGRYLRAVQAKDQAAVNTLQNRVTADRQRLGAFDEQGFQSAEAALFQPYADRYARAMARAGLAV